MPLSILMPLMMSALPFNPPAQAGDAQWGSVRVSGFVAQSCGLRRSGTGTLSPPSCNIRSIVSRQPPVPGSLHKRNRVSDPADTIVVTPLI